METCMLNDAVNKLGTPGWPSSDRVLLSKDNPYRQVTLHEFTNF